VSGFRDIALEQGINAVRGLLNVVEKAVEEEAREMMKRTMRVGKRRTSIVMHMEEGAIPELEELRQKKEANGMIDDGQGAAHGVDQYLTEEAAEEAAVKLQSLQRGRAARRLFASMNPSPEEVGCTSLPQPLTLSSDQKYHSYSDIPMISGTAFRGAS